MQEFYQNKFVEDLPLLTTLEGLNRVYDRRVTDAQAYCAKRKEALEGTIHKFLEEGKISEGLSFGRVYDSRTHLLFAQCFPKTILQFSKENVMAVLRQLHRQTVFFILDLSEERKRLLSMIQAEQSESEKESMMEGLCSFSITQSCNPFLFEMLLEVGAMDVAKTSGKVHNVQSLKWMESHGVDFRDKEIFQTRVNHYAPSVIEYLMVEREWSIAKIMKSLKYYVIIPSILDVFVRVEGVERIKSDLKADSMWLDGRGIRLLKEAGYQFDKLAILSRAETSEICAAMVLNIVSRKDLDYEFMHKFQRYAEVNDLKTCNVMYPFMKDIRKKKIITVFLCIRRIHGKQVPKEIVWNILDNAYSPINERGKF